MKKTLLAVALTAASMTAIADVKLSGHTSYSAGDFSDLDGSEGISVDAYGASDSRFRLVFDHEANGITYGGKLEFAFGDVETANLTKRVSEVTAAGNFGKISLGQGSTSLDGVSEASFNRGAGAENLDAYNFNKTTAGTGVYGLANFGFGGQQDGGRQERIRYDSPSFSGFTFSASYDDNNVTEEFADTIEGGDNASYHIRYANDMIIAQLGATNADADNSDKTSASIAGKMGNFNAHIQYFEQEAGVTAATSSTAASLNTEKDKSQKRFAVGYDMNDFAFTVDYTLDEQDDASNASVVDASSIGLSATYFPTKGVSLFAGVRKFSDDSDATAATNTAGTTNVSDSATGFVLGAKVTF